MESARNGTTRSPTLLELISDLPAALAWDANHGWGPVALTEAMAACIARAAQTGSCIGVIRNVGHIGRLGYYAEAAAKAGVIGMISCSGNPGNAVQAPWGGRDARLSTNPLAFGFPHSGGDDVVVDISTTQAARGKVLLAAASGQPLPEGWAFDRGGAATTDPATALPPNGTLAPLGGHKGYALAIAVELLCGALAGAYPPEQSAVFLAVIAADKLAGRDEYAASVSAVEAAMVSSEPRPGGESVRLPGAGAAERRRRAQQDGIRVASRVWHDACTVAASLGVAPP